MFSYYTHSYNKVLYSFVYLFVIAFQATVPNWLKSSGKPLLWILIVLKPGQSRVQSVLTQTETLMKIDIFVIEKLKTPKSQPGKMLNHRHIYND